jgi:hypothetical protein
MKRSRIVLCAIVASASLAACSGSTPRDIEASLKTATASAIPGSDPSRIEISGQELLKAKWIWSAKYDGKAYACDADDQMRLPSCQATS